MGTCCCREGPDVPVGLSKEPKTKSLELSLLSELSSAKVATTVFSEGPYAFRRRRLGRSAQSSTKLGGQASAATASFDRSGSLLGSRTASADGVRVQAVQRCCNKASAKVSSLPSPQSTSAAPARKVLKYSFLHLKKKRHTRYKRYRQHAAKY